MSALVTYAEAGDMLGLATTTVHDIAKRCEWPITKQQRRPGRARALIPRKLVADYGRDHPNLSGSPSKRFHELRKWADGLKQPPSLDDLRSEAGDRPVNELQSLLETRPCRGVAPLRGFEFCKRTNRCKDSNPMCWFAKRSARPPGGRRLFTDRQVKFIRRSGKTNAQLARHYNVSLNTISDIRALRSYKWVTQ